MIEHSSPFGNNSAAAFKLIHADSAPKQKYFPAIPENMKKAGLDGLPFSNTIKKQHSV